MCLLIYAFVNLTKNPNDPPPPPANVYSPAIFLMAGTGKVLPVPT